MEYALFAIGGITLLVLGALILRSRNHQTPETAEEHPRSALPSPETQAVRLRDADRFWGFRVESHCRASSRLAGRQFAFDERLPVPVAGCESGQCACCLIGLPERRVLADRRSGMDRRRSIRLEDSDRRAERPRRRSDLNFWGAYSHL
ncbi:MAG: hypothetical protein KDJ39_17865 [Gammaproteobacteria bacterium]|nr:hypothetical protein [Gammaproteobacteria bacterium]